MCLAQVCWLCKPGALSHLSLLLGGLLKLSQQLAGWPAAVCALSRLSRCSPPASPLHQPWHGEESRRQGKGWPGVIAAEIQLLRRLGADERRSGSC